VQLNILKRKRKFDKKKIKAEKRWRKLRKFFLKTDKAQAQIVDIYFKI